MPNESVKLVSTLTEEEVNATAEKLASKLDLDEIYLLDSFINSHRSLNSRNLKLVLENDELMADNMLRRNYESFLNSVIMGRETLQEGHDFEWFKKKWKSIKNTALEGLTYDQPIPSNQ